jgi:hypothetical protein
VQLLTWKWFVGAATLVAGVLYKNGVPIVAILGGIAVAAAVTWRWGK